MPVFCQLCHLLPCLEICIDAVAHWYAFPLLCISQALAVLSPVAMITSSNIQLFLKYHYQSCSLANDKTDQEPANIGYLLYLQYIPQVCVCLHVCAYVCACMCMCVDARTCTPELAQLHVHAAHPIAI